ncbi:MAG: LacI family DNA-binding transcriptional regulator [Planctomycetota bacterium]|nr:LacI family DNA-binding transcriptional regulator [Planctomycetota bacterium]
MRRITMYDVAKAAGVSQAAVSKILSKKDPWVSEATRKRVFEAADQLGYRQNFHARLLRTGRTWCLGLMGNLSGFALDNYVYTKTCRGIEDELNTAKSPYSLLMFGANWGENHEKSLKLVERGMVDGLIWILLASKLAEFEKQVAPWLRARRVPFVVVHSLSRRAFDYPNVGYDSFGGARAMTAHLAKRRGRVGIFLAAPDSPQSQETFDGYRQGLKDAGLPFDRSLLLHEAPQAERGGNLFEIAYRTAKALPRASLPESVFASIDASAYGFLKGFRERGIRVPEDIAVAGMDDEVSTRYGEEELTTIAHPFREKGRAAVRILTGLLDGSLPAEPIPQTVVKHALVVRTTCGQSAPKPERSGKG